MPEQSKRTPSDIVRDVTQQETFRFSPQLSPGRRARGPEIPLDISNDSAQIAEGLGILGDIAGAAAQVSGEFDERKARELTQEGSFAAIRAGTELDALKGEVAANPLAFTPDDIRSRQEEIYNRALAGKNEDFRNGFLPQAVRDQASFDRKVRAMQEEAHNEQKISDTIMTMDNRFDSLIEEATTFDKDQVLGIFTDRETLEQFNLGVETNRERVAELTRNMLNEAQELNPRIPKKEFSRAFVISAAKKAVSLGAPELLDFASVPGTDGIPIDATDLRELVDRNRALAADKKEDNTLGISKAEEKARKEAVVDGFNFMSDQIDLLLNKRTEITPEEWSATKSVIEDQLVTLRTIDTDKSKVINEQLDFVRDLDQDIPLVSNPTVEAYLLDHILFKTGSVSLVDSLKEYLTVDDRLSYAKRMPDWEGDTDPAFDTDDMVRKQVESFNVFTTKKFGGPIYENGADLKTDATLLFYDAVNEHYRKGTQIDRKLLKAIKDDIIQEFDEFKTRQGRFGSDSSEESDDITPQGRAKTSVVGKFRTNKKKE